MTDHYEDLREEARKAWDARVKAKARVAAGPMGLLEDYPWLGYVMLVGVIIAVTAMVISYPATGPEKRAAYDRAELECRKSGGTYEWFRSQGYHCIGGK